MYAPGTSHPPLNSMSPSLSRQKRGLFGVCADNIGVALPHVLNPVIVVGRCPLVPTRLERVTPNTMPRRRLARRGRQARRVTELRDCTYYYFMIVLKEGNNGISCLPLFIHNHPLLSLPRYSFLQTVCLVQYRRDARANTYFRQTVIQSVREGFVLIVHSKPPSQFSQSVGGRADVPQRGRLPPYSAIKSSLWTALVVCDTNREMRVVLLNLF